MVSISDLLIQALEKVWITFVDTWPFLLVSILISVGLRLYINTEKVSAYLTRYRRMGVIGATAAAVGTPLCSGGTTAVILGMMASTIPWAPIVAFMVASPLTSPEEFIYSAGLFGWPFAISFFVSSILLGLLGGTLAEAFEARGWLANQARFSLKTAEDPGCVCESRGKECQSSRSKTQSPKTTATPVTAQRWVVEFYRTGKQLLAMFLGFAFLGYVLNGLIPPMWINAIFGKGNVYSVPLAATLGLPFYLNSEGSLPLVRSLIDGGMSHGAALAFLISGAGTSIGAIAGALTIARWRVLSLVVGTLWMGAIVLGYTYDLLLAVNLF